MNRTAVVGCGHWGANHVRVLAELRGAARVVAVDVRESRLERIAAAFAGVARERTVEAVLSDPTVDSVVIATPTETHFGLVKQALHAGKNVLCEKPLCQTSEQGRELVDLASANGLRLAVGFVFLYNAGLRAVRQLIRQGEAGSVHYCAAVRTNLGPVRSDVNAAYDLAAHDIAVFNWLLDSSPERVSAVGGAFLQPGIEDVVFISLAYPNGVMANVHASWLNPCKIRQMTVVGSLKMITWDDLNLQAPVAIYDKGVNPIEDTTDYGRFLRMTMWENDVRLPKISTTEPLRDQDAAFLRSLSADEPELPDGRFGLEVTRVLEAIGQSIASDGRPIGLPEVD